MLVRTLSNYRQRFKQNFHKLLYKSCEEQVLAYEQQRRAERKLWISEAG